MRSIETAVGLAKLLSKEADAALADNSRCASTDKFVQKILTTDVGCHEAILTGGGVAASGMIAQYPLRMIFQYPLMVIITSYLMFIGKRRLALEKKALADAIIKKQSAIIDELQKEVNASEERIKYLSRLNVLLQEALKELEKSR